MLCKFRAETSHFFFFMWNELEIFDGSGEKLLQTKAAPIARSFDLSLVSE